MLLPTGVNAKIRSDRCPSPTNAPVVAGEAARHRAGYPLLTSGARPARQMSGAEHSARRLPSTYLRRLSAVLLADATSVAPMPSHRHILVPRQSPLIRPALVRGGPPPRSWSVCGRRETAREGGGTGAVNFDLGVQGMGLLILSALAFGVVVQALMWRSTTHWLWLIGAGAWFIGGLFMSEVVFGHRRPSRTCSRSSTACCSMRRCWVASSPVCWLSLRRGS